jgi:DNA-directed RNA polymerase subunit M/transcription elongation factor TFIIS
MLRGFVGVSVGKKLLFYQQKIFCEEEKMSDFLRCTHCCADLEDWNTGTAFIRYCPACGRKLYKAVAEGLRRLCTDDEIADMIEGQVLDMLDNYEDIDTGEAAYTAWESENANGVVFCSNYTADRFAIRHREWVDEALMSLIDRYGDDGKE